MKKIGIIGSGNVGQALAMGFQKYNYPVMIGSRNPNKLGEWKSKNGFNGKTGTFEEAAAFGEILVLCVKGSKAKEAMKLTGEDNHKGKIVIDTNNPISDEAPVNGVLKFTSDINYSLMEELQSEFAHVRFVKAFSCTGSHLMVNPEFKERVKPAMFICGNDSKAKKEVKEILDQFGHETFDMGSVEAARAIEPLCILWCIPGLTGNQWEHAFAMLKKW